MCFVLQRYVKKVIYARKIGIFTWFCLHIQKKYAIFARNYPNNE